MLNFFLKIFTPLIMRNPEKNTKFVQKKAWH